MASESIKDLDLMVEIKVIYYDKASQEVLETLSSTEDGLVVDEDASSYFNDSLIDLVQACNERAKANRGPEIDLDDPILWVNAAKIAIKRVRRKYPDHAKVDERAVIFSQTNPAAKDVQTQLFYEAVRS